MVTDYIKKIEENKDEMIGFLQELIRINSVRNEPVTTKTGSIFPFGQGVSDAFQLVLNKGKDFGFETANIDNYGGHIDMGIGEEIVGILGHLDVVPEGDGWTHGPFSGDIADGKIYGRGTTDDKGPVVASLFAMKALAQCGFEPDKKVRLILGLDEETAWNGMHYYLSKVKPPNYGITPDAEFPAINGEKGIITFELAKKFGKTTVKGLELRSLKGGSAENMVPDHARAVIRSIDMSIYVEIKEQITKYRSDTGSKINVKGIGKSLEITTQGIAAHGANPQRGLNAISVMMDFLSHLNFVNDDINDFIDLYNKYIGFNTNGVNLGCGFCDEPSGELTLNVGIIDLIPEAATLTINVRYPVTCTDTQIYDGIMPVINKYNLGIIKLKHKPPIYMAPDSPMIKALMSIYQKHTGDTVSKPQVIGGGTYARATPNIVAFGGAFPGDEDLMHQKNECIEIDKLMTMTKIYADTIYTLSQKDFSLNEE
ncbi:MAG: dipeptidase PepV [Anaerovoracaceae bacterium]